MGIWWFLFSDLLGDLDADVETSQIVSPTATRMVIACTTFPMWSNPVVTTKPTHVANPIIKPIFERTQLSTPRKWIQIVKMRYQGYGLFLGLQWFTKFPSRTPGKVNAAMEKHHFDWVACDVT